MTGVQTCALPISTIAFSGSGLGLALVDQQAHLHHGTLHLGTTPTGGLKATLDLPSTPDDDPRERPTLD